jgi:transcriptional regulator with XRE-family HTH domain
MASRDRAAALRMLRGLRHITQRELARRCSIHHATISAFERGRQNLSAHHLERLLSALEVTPRGWEATERHVEWIDYLTSAEGTALDQQSLMLAESVARSFEMHTGALLHLLEALSGGGR